MYNDIKVSDNELSKITHEINNLYYSKFEGLRFIAHRSVGLDNRYYIYILENNGFDNYRLITRYLNLDDERNSKNEH